MPRQLITIPRNLSAATTRVLYVDAAGASQVVDVSAALGAEPMETNRPVREFYAWPGKRNYRGAVVVLHDRQHDPLREPARATGPHRS